MRAFACKNYLLTANGISVFGLLLIDLFCNTNYLEKFALLSRNT